LLTINELTAVGRVKNDVTVGQYDVVMETGPGYNSKRQEAVDAMLPLLQKPELFQIAGDLVFRNMDFPGAETIADRLAAMNPLSQIDEHSEIPPQAQMMIKQAQAQAQQAQQQMQAMQLAMKQRSDIEQVKQDSETKRELMRVTAKAHDIELRDAERKYVAELNVHGKAQEADLKSQTALEIENLKGQFALVLAHLDAKARSEASAETTERAI